MEIIKNYDYGGITLSCGFCIINPDFVQTILLAVVGTLTSYLLSKILISYDKQKLEEAPVWCLFFILLINGFVKYFIVNKYEI